MNDVVLKHIVGIYAQLTSSYPGALSANAKIEGRIFFRRIPKVTDLTIVTEGRSLKEGFLAKSDLQFQE